MIGCVVALCMVLKATTGKSEYLFKNKIKLLGA